MPVWCQGLGGRGGVSGGTPCALKVLGVGTGAALECQPGNLLNVQEPRPLPPARMEIRIQWGWAPESPTEFVAAGGLGFHSESPWASFI